MYTAGRGTTYLCMCRFELKAIKMCGTVRESKKAGVYGGGWLVGRCSIWTCRQMAPGPVLFSVDNVYVQYTHNSILLMPFALIASTASSI
jgi:hypothetical protein